MPSRKKIGLALGNGAFRGWAHIGAIEALEEAGVVVTFRNINPETGTFQILG